MDNQNLRRILYNTGTTIIFLLSAFLSFSQSSLIGKVKTEDGRPLKNVKIYLLNTGYFTTTTETGDFYFNNLKPGRYTINLLHPNYASVTIAVNIKETDMAATIVLYDQYESLEEVVVSAEKKEQEVISAPIAVTVVGSKDIEEKRLWSLEDLSSIAPNFFTSNPGDNRNITSVRGIVSTAYEQAVATYIDGVSQFNLDTYIPQLFDVKRIEILRGAQSMLYGRNAMGGVLHVLTKKPTNSTEGFAEISAGRFNTNRFTAAIRTPIQKDKLFFGVAGLMEGTDGYYHNSFNNGKYDSRRSAIVNSYLNYVLSPSWTFSLNIKKAFNRNNGAFPLASSAEEAFSNPFVLSQNATSEMTDNLSNFSLTATHLWGQAILKSITAFQSNYRYYKGVIDADFSALDAISIFNNYGKDWNYSNVFTQEFNANSKELPGKKFSWSAGSFLFWHDNPVKQATRFGEDAELIGMPSKNFSMINSISTKANGIAVYGGLDYQFSDKLKLSAGFRFDHEQKKQSIVGEYQVDPDPQPLFDYRPDTNAIAKFNALSPKIVLMYKASAENTLYLSYNQGYRAGGLTSLSADPSTPPLYRYDPEHSHSYEAGFKNRFNNRFMLNLYLFYIKVAYAQVPTLILPEAITITKNMGKLVSKGIETELKLIATNQFSIDHSFGFTKATYKDLKLSANGSIKDLKGNKQVFTPESTSMLALRYNFQLSKQISINMMGEWRWLGKQYFDLPNTIEQPSYHLFNSKIRFVFKQTAVSLWMKNMGDEQYISYAYDFGAVHLGDPRTYGVSLKLEF